MVKVLSTWSSRAARQTTWLHLNPGTRVAQESTETHQSGRCCVVGAAPPALHNHDWRAWTRPREGALLTGAGPALDASSGCSGRSHLGEHPAQEGLGGETKKQPGSDGWGGERAHDGWTDEVTLGRWDSSVSPAPAARLVRWWRDERAWAGSQCPHTWGRGRAGSPSPTYPLSNPATSLCWSESHWGPLALHLVAETHPQTGIRGEAVWLKRNGGLVDK